MNDSAEVLVDTSAWIDYFRGKEPCRPIVASLLERDCIFCAGLVLAELIQGAKGETELEVLRDFPRVFRFLPETTEAWVEAGELSRRLRVKGKTVGLSDCFLAVLAAKAGARILTRDHHFRILAPEAGVSLYTSPRLGP
ncbi:MAG: PIN domain-containing protein [Candidatus Omnitrophica bacterium]|nr:tRNA(fMet)-specific endonuclease VapC [bacterium]NUN97932.1 PIN domain-containing protein [Candidatus Omnitrophota bacterium]